jgi:hypothetical protein
MACGADRRCHRERRQRIEAAPRRDVAYACISASRQHRERRSRTLCARSMHRTHSAECELDLRQGKARGLITSIMKTGTLLPEYRPLRPSTHPSIDPRTPFFVPITSSITTSLQKSPRPSQSRKHGKHTRRAQPPPSLVLHDDRNQQKQQTPAIRCAAPLFCVGQRARTRADVSSSRSAGR